MSKKSPFSALNGFTKPKYVSHPVAQRNNADPAEPVCQKVTDTNRAKVPADSADMKPYPVSLCPELRDSLKLAAFDAGVSLSSLLVAALQKIDDNFSTMMPADYKAFIDSLCPADATPGKKTSLTLPRSLMASLRRKSLEGHLTLNRIVLAALAMATEPTK